MLEGNASRSTNATLIVVVATCYSQGTSEDAHIHIHNYGEVVGKEDHDGTVSLQVIPLHQYGGDPMTGIRRSLSTMDSEGVSLRV